MRNPVYKIHDNVPQQESAARGSASLESSTEHLIHLAREMRAMPATVSIDFSRLRRLSGRCFLLSDLIALFAAYDIAVVAASLYHLLTRNIAPAGFLGVGFTSSFSQFLISIVLGGFSILWFDTKGHYRQRLPFWETLGHFAKACVVGFVCGGFVQYAMKDSYSRLQLGLFWGLFSMMLIMGRGAVRDILTRAGQWQIGALIIGNKKTAQNILRALDNEPTMGFEILSQIAPDKLGSLLEPEAWRRLLVTNKASHIFVAMEGGEMEMHQRAIQSLVRARVPYSIVPAWLGLPVSNLSPHHFMMHDVFFLQNTSRLRIPLLRFYKRSVDIVLSLAAMIVLSPLFAVVALIVKRDGGSAFFSQPRVGRDSRQFACYKFRSMRPDAEAVLQKYLADNPAANAEWQKFQKIRDDVRITPFGKIIRKLSIDELPQLFNVLKGDMSLVGPRPIMPEQAVLYGEDYTYYEAMRPGITGPWQVCGRSKLTFTERVALESWYARNWNPWTDFAIILKTFPALLSRGQAV